MGISQVKNNYQSALEKFEEVDVIQIYFYPLSKYGGAFSEIRKY